MHGRQHATPEERTAQLRSRWLERYANSSMFRVALERFYELSFVPVSAHLHGDDAGCPLAWVESRAVQIEIYRSELDTFCREWGINRLYPVAVAVRTAQAANALEWGAIFDASEPNGTESVHLWCWNRRRGRDFFDPLNHGIIYLPSRDRDGREWLTLDSGSTYPRPGGQIRIEGFSVEWDPTREPWEVVEKRILANVRDQARSQHDVLVRNVELGGYESVDTRHRLDLHLDWMFQHVVLGRKYDEISADDRYRHSDGGFPDLTSIARAVSRLAPQIGLRLDRPPS